MQEKINIVNKKAKFKYFLLKKYIAGLVLNGSEIKSIRQKKANIDRAFCTFFNNELYVNNIIIENYLNSSSFDNVLTENNSMYLYKSGSFVDNFARIFNSIQYIFSKEYSKTNLPFL